MQTIELRDYNIYVGHIWRAFNQFIKNNYYSSIFVLVDENTRECCLPIFRENAETKDFKIIEIPSGENNKNIDTCQLIWQSLMDQQASRQSLMIQLGGGVIGDMGGFCAGTYKRGIDFVQIPTTLLSQVDSSIGGKLGIDFGQIKNSIGLFKNPKAVFVDPIFLKTLPYNEIRSGFAEMIKHSLIADAAQWKKQNKAQNLDKVNWEVHLTESLSIKKRIVEADPFEHNIRKALNFGHTIGHAIESYFLESDNPLLHGEAIAAGMVCESWLSNKKAGLPNSSLEEISSFIKRIYGKAKIPEHSFEILLGLMRNDKKNRGNEINFTLLEEIGVARINFNCSDELIRQSLLYYQEL